MVKIPGKRVLVYIPSYLGTMDAMAVEGLIHLINDCWTWKEKGWQFYPVISKRMFIQDARNTAVSHALKQDMDYVLFIDDDMVIKPESKLFTSLVTHDKDITVPLFFHRRHPFAPLIFKRVIRAGGKYTTFDNIMDYPKGLIEVDGAGCGVMLIKTEVFKKIGEPYFYHSNGFGEDLYFCNKAISAGFKIYCDTRLEVGHIGDPRVAWESTYRQNEKSSKLYMAQKIANDEKSAAKMVKTVDIIMPCYHNYTLTKAAVESIINNTAEGTDWNLILVNDGADKQLEKYFKRIEKHWPNITHITNKKNVGWVKAINQGIGLSKSECILFANNDIEIPAGHSNWLNIMADRLQQPDIGAVGPISNFVMGLQNADYNKAILLQEHYTKFLIGFFMMIKREAVEKVGLLDECFGLGGNDDLDYSIRLRQAGYKLKILRNVFIQHKGFASLGKVYKDYKEVEDLTRPRLVEKWGKTNVDSLFEYDMKTLNEGD